MPSLCMHYLASKVLVLMLSRCLLLIILLAKPSDTTSARANMISLCTIGSNILILRIRNLEGDDYVAGWVATMKRRLCHSLVRLVILFDLFLCDLIEKVFY